MVWFGAIAELTSVGATTLMSLIGATRIVASRAAQRTAASDAGDPSTPTTMLDRMAGMKLRPPVRRRGISRRHRFRDRVECSAYLLGILTDPKRLHDLQQADQDEPHTGNDVERNDRIKRPSNYNAPGDHRYDAGNDVPEPAGQRQ